MCILFFFSCLSYDCVCCPHEGVRYVLAFSFTDYSTCGRVFVRLICGSSGKALFSSLCVLFPVLSWQYIVIYISLCLQAEEIWGYYWAAGKASSKIHVSDVLLQVATTFRGYYTTLFPRKVIACFKDLFLWAELYFFTSCCFG